MANQEQLSSKQGTACHHLNHKPGTASVTELSHKMQYRSIKTRLFGVDIFIQWYGDIVIIVT